MARMIPISLAFVCLFSGNLEEAIEIKMILSIPKIISKKVRVNKEMMASNEKRFSMGKFKIYTEI